MINYERIIEFARDKHAGHPFTGFDHIQRVHNLCLNLAEGLDVNIEVLRCAAYLHDIAVPVLGPENHNEHLLDIAGDLMAEIGISKEEQNRINEIVLSHTRYVNIEPVTIEAKILKDADGIDYLGAIGILRGVLRDYRKSKYSGNVSDEGEILLQDLISTVENTFSTEKGIAMANDRITFIKNFLDRLDKESAEA